MHPLVAEEPNPKKKKKRKKKNKKERTKQMINLKIYIPSSPTISKTIIL
jgi:hypothetical protein